MIASALSSAACAARAAEAAISCALDVMGLNFICRIVKKLVSSALGGLRLFVLSSPFRVVPSQSLSIQSCVPLLPY
jgi:hypothetical protein